MIARHRSACSTRPRPCPSRSPRRPTRPRRGRSACPPTTTSRTSSCWAWAAAASPATSLAAVAGRSCPCPWWCTRATASRTSSTSSRWSSPSRSPATPRRRVEAAGAAVDAPAPASCAISRGGALAELAARVGRAARPVAPDASRCRAGRHSARSPSRRWSCSSEIGLFPGASAWIDAAVDAARPAPRRAHQRRQPGRASWPGASGARFPIVYGGGGLGGLAAERWKTQFNENAKAPAFANAGARALPQRDLRLGPARRRHPPGASSSSCSATTSSTRRSPAGSTLVDDAARRGRRRGRTRSTAEGEGSLAQLLDLVLFGDFVSLHPAAAAGRRPGPGPGPGRHQSASAPARPHYTPTPG